MKQTRKLLSLLLALAMVCALAATAFAATVTIPSDGILKGHTFTAYQIFSGREERGILSDVQWGSGINSDNFLAALKADSTYGNLFTNCTEAAAVADVLSANNTNTALANAVAKLAYANKTDTGTALTSGENTLADGYYLIVDTTANVGEGGAYNASLLQVVGNINITVKTDAPTVEKKVQEGGADKDAADYNIGDAVPFRLIGSVPDMSRYDTYKYIFHDTLSTGLTLNAGSIKVYVADDKAGTNKSDITSSWTVGTGANGETFTVSCNNIKAINSVSQGKYIIVEYTATLNQNAVIGLPGNSNKVYLEYSNKPDQSGSGDTDNTGKTPEDEVLVFTYELDTTKVDGKNPDTKLRGAKFVLLNSDGNKVAKITNGKFDGWQNLPSAGADGKIAAESWPTDSVLTSNENGLFTVTGLDAGTYKLREIVAPAGYNLLKKDIVVVITATIGANADGKTTLTNLAVTADGTAGTGNVNSGIVDITVANNKGATLPETGGIGTTIFYTVGGILVLVAVVLLVTKKRMNGTEV
ncbi:MAG: isopeptide-forming domain-containing fimbrial protein [Clostridiales bacterium]|nr:isopeptide-forming domain-containing fimbrial protein [Clostridiales bacterium]